MVALDVALWYIHVRQPYPNGWVALTALILSVVILAWMLWSVCYSASALGEWIVQHPPITLIEVK